MPNLRIIIDVNTDGDAFQPTATAGMRRVFSDAESAVFHSEKFGRGLDAESILFDENGNRCGRVRLEYDSPTCTTDGCNETAVCPRRVPHVTENGTVYGSHLLLLCSGCAARHDAEPCETCDGDGAVRRTEKWKNDGSPGGRHTVEFNDECPECDGTGTVEISIGGDGYGGRCAATADVETDCIFCDGTGKGEK